MAQIVWSKLALKDIELIHNFIAGDSVIYARQTIENFFSRVKILQEFPESGRQIPEFMRRDLRELIDGNYRIF